MIREVITISTPSPNTHSAKLSCGHDVEVDAEQVETLRENSMRYRERMMMNCEECDTVNRGYRKADKMKPIPITAAKRIAEEYGYDQVVIYGRRCHDSPEPHGEHLTTYGKTKEHCSVAARIADTLKKFMGWNA